MVTQYAREDATNSELDAKQIVTNSGLTSAQRDELIAQFVEIQLDNKDTQSLYELASEYVTNSFDRLTDSEIKERIESLYDEELYDELVNNVTNEIAQPKVTITPQELEGDISTVTDDDYADKVDTFVGNMVASDDNVFTHDSEGC